MALGGRKRAQLQVQAGVKKGLFGAGDPDAPDHHYLGAGELQMIQMIRLA
jgi:hypothetical protein